MHNYNEYSNIHDRYCVYNCRLLYQRLCISNDYTLSVGIIYSCCSFVLDMAFWELYYQRNKEFKQIILDDSN